MEWGFAKYKDFRTYVLLKNGKICEIILPQKSIINFEFEKTEMACKIAEKVNKWVFEGESFEHPFNLWGTEFQKEVLNIVLKIPKGKVTTYGDVARILGSPNSARAVGQVMAKNKVPLLVPCHRVVSNDLTLGGYGGGLWMKKQILEFEGIEFSKKRVKKDFLWKFP